MKIGRRIVAVVLAVLIVVSAWPQGIVVASETEYDKALADFGKWLQNNTKQNYAGGGFYTYEVDNMSLEITFTKTDGVVTDIQFKCDTYWKNDYTVYTRLVLTKGTQEVSVEAHLTYLTGTFNLLGYEKTESVLSQTVLLPIGKLDNTSSLFTTTSERLSAELNEDYLAYAREQVIRSVLAAKSFVEASGHVLADFGFTISDDSINDAVLRGLGNFKAVNRYTNGQFSDVKSSDWYAKYVEWAYNYALMGGTRTDFFNADGNVTIAETITMAAGMNSIYNTGTKSFEQSTPWYQTYVDYAIEQGIITENQFTDYGKAATRTEFVTIMSSAFPEEAFPAINNITKIPDVPKTMTHADRIYMFYDAGIIAGSDEYGTFNPNSSIKRSEVAVIVRNMVLKDSRGRTNLKIKEKSNIYFDKTSLTLEVGQEFTCTAVVSEDFPSKAIEYSSNNPAIAKVEQNHVQYATIKCLSPGTATITATAADGMTATCTVTIQGTVPDVLTSLKRLTISKGSNYDSAYIYKFWTDKSGTLSLAYYLLYDTEYDVLDAVMIASEGNSERTIHLFIPNSLSGYYPVDMYYDGYPLKYSASAKISPHSYTMGGTISFDEYTGPSFAYAHDVELVKTELDLLIAYLEIKVLIPNGYSSSDIGFTSFP